MYVVWWVFYSEVLQIILTKLKLIRFLKYSKLDTTVVPKENGNDDGEQVIKEKRLPKRKVAVMIGYCGTGYHGMQYNPPNPTIESELFRAFSEAGAISKDNSTDLSKNGFMRAARTDKGVHAGGNLISLKLIIEDPDIKQKINDKLPEGIRVWDIERVNKAFDCRKMCGSRWYEYLLPTYALLGPKPGSLLYENIVKSKEEYPGVVADDEDSINFWTELEGQIKETFSEEELKAIQSFSPLSTDEFADNEALYLNVKKYKQLENKHKRKYRLSEKKLSHFSEAMNRYLGAHNFHNFTLGKDFKESSAIRFMKEIKISRPFVVGDAETEWISIKIHGQSFMLHQIRKMISMATLIARSGCPTDRILSAYGPQKINIPKAPALGLLLESPVFEGYNKRLEKFGYKPIEFSRYQDEMDAFKMKHIYDKIYKEEVEMNIFNGFFTHIDNFDRHVQGSESSEKTGNDIQRGIFDYLTAKGIPSVPAPEKPKTVSETEEVETDSAVADKPNSVEGDIQDTTVQDVGITDSASQRNVQA